MTLLPHTLYPENPVVSIFKVYPESDHFFSPHCYHAGLSHHHLLTGPCFIPALFQSLYHTAAGWFPISLQTRRDILAVAGKVVLSTLCLWLYPFYLLHSPGTLCCSWTTLDSSPPQGIAFSDPSPGMLFLWFPMIYFPLFYVFPQMSPFWWHSQIYLSDNSPVSSKACHLPCFTFHHSIIQLLP